MRSSIILIVFSISLFNCKTITMDDKQVTANIPEDIELIRIPAGAYTSGASAVEKYINYDYEMMKYPVTNAQFIMYVKAVFDNLDINITSQGVTGYYHGDENWAAGTYNFVSFSDPDCRMRFYPPDIFTIIWRWVDGRKENYDNHPATEVTWFGANAFAEYYGMKLPNHEEWEKAARANNGYNFPWGNTFDTTKVNFKDSGDIYDNDTTPVGFYNGENNTTDSYSPYGIYDMCGNVWEWIDSWKGQSPGKIVKGGSMRSLLKKDSDGIFDYMEFYTWFEPSFGYSPNNSSHDLGFRCVKIL